MAADNASGIKRPDTEHLSLPTFDPNPSGMFAHDVLRAANVDGVLIGRLAVWAWIPEESEHAYTKDLDIAVTREGLVRLREFFHSQGTTTRELPIGGVNVKMPQGINVDFVDRELEPDGLAPLFEDAVKTAMELGKTVSVGGASLVLVSPEHLTAMKLATLERKDEEDSERLLSYSQVDIEKLRLLVKTFLGPVGSIRLENLLRVVEHPLARPRRKYNGDAGRGQEG